MAKDNLGAYPALTAASALLTDYVLTVSVSAAAGIAALTSPLPALGPFRVHLAVLAVVVVAVGNLRGVRESGKLFAARTYFFILTTLSLLGYGRLRRSPGGPHIALPGLATTAARVRGRRNGHDRPTGVPAAPLVAPHPAQPNRAADQGPLLFRRNVVVTDVPYLLPARWTSVLAARWGPPVW